MAKYLIEAVNYYGNKWRDEKGPFYTENIMCYGIGLCINQT